MQNLECNSKIEEQNKTVTKVGKMPRKDVNETAPNIVQERKRKGVN